MAQVHYILVLLLLSAPVWAQDEVTFVVNKAHHTTTELYGPEEQLCLVSLVSGQLDLITCSDNTKDITTKAMERISQVVVPKGCSLANAEVTYYDYYKSHQEASIYLADSEGRLSPQFYLKLRNAQAGDYLEFQNVLIERDNGERYKVEDFSFTVIQEE